MSKHTPGPWEVRNRVEVFSKLGADSGDGCPAHATDGWMIADCEPGVHTLTEGGYSTELGLELKEANARLIAAAPEMFEALDNISGLSRALRVGGPDPMDLQGLSDALEEAIGLALDAMAKATA